MACLSAFASAFCNCKFLLLAICCLILGWTNGIMIVRFETFSTMMVGNTVFMGVALSCDKKKHPRFLDDLVCPTKFPVAYYGALIFIFVLGSFSHGFLEAMYHWTPRHFACVLALVACSQFFMLEFGVFIDDGHLVYVLSFVFGIVDSVALKDLGGVPWASTGNMVNAAYHFAHYLAKFEKNNARKAVEPFIMWAVFFQGVIMGNIYNSRLCQTCLLLVLAGLFMILDSASWQRSASLSVLTPTSASTGNKAESDRERSPLLSSP
eukprot:TRINITY_DN72743_c0_g1_i1.p1 TRINITY_DN72743_c0_g1~~TRINITY_DN72743_c0_g1_i1.p1  ORF type:complete len:278 (-),score=48.32 TRINITY_DN72743_c0_g1_i1:87-881(-)